MGVLKDKVALVTGSSRGIGAAAAKIFAREGARVAIHGREESALARTPDDVARTALFLVSDDSSWITAVILDAAGGAVMVR